MLFKRQVSLWLACFNCLTISCGSKNCFNCWNFGGNQPLLQQSVIVSFRECFRVDTMVAFLLIHLGILDFQANTENGSIRKSYIDMENRTFADRRNRIFIQNGNWLKNKRLSSSRITTSVYSGLAFRFEQLIQWFQDLRFVHLKKSACWLRRSWVLWRKCHFWNT